MSLYRPCSPAVSPAGPGWGPDGPAGHRAIPARPRTGIQNTSSAGPLKRAGRPPGGPAPGPVSLDWPSKHLKVLKMAWKFIKKGYDMYQRENMVCGRNQQPTNLFARNST
jgi:hypothetical protein